MHDQKNVQYHKFFNSHLYFIYTYQVPVVALFIKDNYMYLLSIDIEWSLFDLGTG